jgi:hypothetical protein
LLAVLLSAAFVLLVSTPMVCLAAVRKVGLRSSDMTFREAAEPAWLAVGSEQDWERLRVRVMQLEVAARKSQDENERLHAQIQRSQNRVRQLEQRARTWESYRVRAPMTIADPLRPLRAELY